MHKCRKNCWCKQKWQSQQQTFKENIFILRERWQNVREKIFANDELIAAKNRLWLEKAIFYVPIYLVSAEM
jgi:hypothetical protein